MVDRQKGEARALSERVAEFQESLVPGSVNEFVVKAVSPNGQDFYGILRMDRFSFGQGRLAIPLASGGKIVRRRLVELNRRSGVERIENLGYEPNTKLGSNYDQLTFSYMAYGEEQDIIIARDILKVPFSKHLTREGMVKSVLNFMGKLTKAEEGWFICPVPVEYLIK